MSRIKPQRVTLHYYHAEGVTFYFATRKAARASLRRYEAIMDGDLDEDEDSDDIEIDTVVYEFEIHQLTAFAVSLLGNRAIDFGNGGQTEFVI